VNSPLDTSFNSSKPDYVGRFAPSPTGPLHFGSLVAALASFLDARHFGGRWLVRIEDLDPPREQVGAATAILACLDAHRLYWDGEVLYQSQRHAAYEETLHALNQRSLIYPCFCKRKELTQIGGPYPGTCRPQIVQSLPTDKLATNKHENTESAFALRLRTEALPTPDCHLVLPHNFDDIFMGAVTCQQSLGDFIVKRKDGLYAYQLAVVVDDIYQGITHVIRGADLLDSTPSQQFLFACHGLTPPQFGHFPLALNNQGQKLSKQHNASDINNQNVRENILAALQFLNHAPESNSDADVDGLLQWAITHWDRNKLPAHDRIVACH